MKYKKQLATGALALSLLVVGSTIYAESPQDIGIKNANKVYQKQNRVNEIKTEKEKGNIVGKIISITNSGFTVDVRNTKSKLTTSFDVKTDVNTIYKKNGKLATFSDLVVGQKVIISGALDRNTNLVTAKIVKIVTNKNLKVKNI